MVIDFHTHTFPDGLAPRAMAQLSDVGQIPYYADGTCAGLLASMDAAGISHAVMAPVATKPAQVRRANEWALEMRGKHARLTGLGAMHPEQTDYAEEVGWLAEHGFRGIKLHPDYQAFFVDEERVLPMYAALAEAGLFILFHAGVDIGLPDPVHCPPERLARVLDAVPNLLVVAAHMGGFQQWNAVREHLVGRDLYFETSFALPWLGAERMAELIRAQGAERVVFGTDSPWADQTEELGGMRALGLSAAEGEAVFAANAARLLGM